MCEALESCKPAGLRVLISSEDLRVRRDDASQMPADSESLLLRKVLWGLEEEYLIVKANPKNAS